MKFYLIGGAILAFAAWTAGVWWYADDHGFNRCKVSTQKAVIEQIAKAREEERAKQEAVNASLKEQAENMASINDRLTRDISRLRERASRRHLPETPQINCQGASGADLSAQDAEFLVREVARADRLRTALKACYDYADTVSK